MTLSYVEQYVAQAVTAQTDEHESYHAFAGEKLAQDEAIYKEKLAELERHKARIEEQHQEKLDQVTYLMRFRSIAGRIARGIKQSLCDNMIVDVQKTIIDNVNSVASNCENDLDDDETYKMLFSQVFIQNDQVNVQSKADYHALCAQLEDNNAQLATNAVYRAAEKRFEAIKKEPASDKYAQKIMAGFAEVEDILQRGSATIGFDLQKAYGAALSRFDIYSEEHFNAKLQLAFRKIAAVTLLQDLDRFKLHLGPSVTPAFIKDLKAIDLSTERFEQAMLPAQRSEKLNELTSVFIEALEKGQRLGSIEKDIAYITQELKNPSYIVHGFI
jgi:hypothetical protein